MNIEQARAINRKRMGMQRILQSRLDAQKPLSAQALLRGGICTDAVFSPEPPPTIDASELKHV